MKRIFALVASTAASLSGGHHDIRGTEDIDCSTLANSVIWAPESTERPTASAHLCTRQLVMGVIAATLE
jgi:hypothetical protein